MVLGLALRGCDMLIMHACWAGWPGWPITAGSEVGGVPWGWSCCWFCRAIAVGCHLTVAVKTRRVCAGAAAPAGALSTALEGAHASCRLLL
jgi:hypothetical protein